MVEDENGEGPRPLRSCSYPHGLPGLHRREWRQLQIGDRLLHFLVEVLVALAVAGGCGFLEHPQHAAWADPEFTTSIWRLRPLKMLARLQCTSVVSFDQCTCGAVARKPTTILLLRLSEVRQKLLQQGDQGRCHHPAGHHVVLKGRQADGTFQTAKAKIYPQKLNQILSTGMFQFAQQMHHEDVERQLPEDFEPYTEMQFQEAHVVQPDFHG